MSEAERIYTVPLKEARNAQRYRRSEKAMMVLKAFAVRHMKASSVKVDVAVNQAIWARGIKNPPNRIRVKMTKDDEGLVTITMADIDAKAEAKKARAEAKAAAKEMKKEETSKVQTVEEAAPEPEPEAEKESKPEADEETKI
jgi:large subunit ribosomal protein L31e